MKLKRLHVENIRSYRKLDLAFEDGVTVISGVNGSGKSSLLEACFMGLFGSKILSKDFVLSDMIFKGEEKAGIELEFEHRGREYRIEQGFRYSKKSNNASNSKAVLYQDGKNLVDQAARTYEEVCALLNMDEEAYQNCAYIRQGEIDVLINAKPRDRQRMIDELLQLGKLEDYRERVKSAKTAVGRLERDTKTRLNDLGEEIEIIEKAEPVKALMVSRQKEKERAEEVQKLTRIKEKAVLEKEKIERLLSEYNERVEEITNLNSEAEKAGKDKRKCFRENEKIDQEILQKKEAKKELEAENSEIYKAAGFGEFDVETLLFKQEKEEALAREKLNELSNKLALVLKDKTTLKKTAEEIVKEIEEAQKALKKCEMELKAEKTGIKAKQEEIQKLEETCVEIRAQAGIEGKKEKEIGKIGEIKGVSPEIGQESEKNEIQRLVKEKEEQESLFRDRKNEIGNKLLLAENERKTCAKTLKELEFELETGQEVLRKSEKEFEALESELKTFELKSQKFQKERAEALKAFKELGFEAEKLEKLEEIGDLLQENKNRLHGNSKALEAQIKELEKRSLKNRKLLAEGKCPTCGQELSGSELSGAVEEAELEKEKLSKKLAELEGQQIEFEQKLEALKAARKLEKQITMDEQELEKYQNNTANTKSWLKNQKAKIAEETQKLAGLEAKKGELESQKKEGLLEIEKLKEQEKEILKAHLESETQLRKAKTFEKELSEKAAAVEKLNGKIQAAGQLIESYKKRREELEEKIKKLESRKNQSQSEFAALNQELLALKEKEVAGKKTHAKTEKLLSQAKKLRENLLYIKEVNHQIAGFEAEIRNIKDKITFLDKEIQEKNESLRKLNEKIEGADFSDLKLKKAQLETALENIEAKFEEISEAKADLLKEIGRLETTLKRYSGLKEDKKALENKWAYLEAVDKNAAELENTYMRIRAELRAKNIGALSLLLNEMFSFMYANNAYSRIELDSEYNLTVFRKDGLPLEPKLLSGGERAIFNLILRCAIYRLLSLSFGGGKGTNLPPMILDEPTVFLDRGHIQQLLKLIDLMRNKGVGQIIIVSHDESLIDSADHVFHVEKDPLTNMSSIRRR